MKIFSVGVQLFHVDGRTDMIKLTFALCNFANLSKNSTWCDIEFLCFIWISEQTATLPYTTLRARFSYIQSVVFTERYALSPYIQQMRVIFKGLKHVIAVLLFTINSLLVHYITYTSENDLLHNQETAEWLWIFVAVGQYSLTLPVNFCL
jgi:hypothetical protein